MVTPYYEEAGITIWHGDCRDIIPTLPACDLLLTDPPYGVAYVTARRLQDDPQRVPVIGDESAWAYDFLARSLDCLIKVDRHWYIFASPRMLPAAMTATTPKQVLAWDKENSGTVGDLVAGFGESWEAILYGMKGRRPLRGIRPRSVIRSDWSSTNDPVHPTVKPVTLLRRLIEWSTDPGEMVFDPFMGSGTTLRAAKDLGRKAIGIEIEERYCEIAVQRLAQEVLAL